MSRKERDRPLAIPGMSRRQFLKTTALGVTVASWGFPAIVRAGADTIKVGHLTPRTGFLGQLGAYAVMGATLAVKEINQAGGVLGRQVELISEDSVNPGVAVTKAQKLVERDKVDFLIGEISSASGLAIAEQALRYKKLYVNTGCNSDALRGSNCNRYMFHVEGCNTMYTKTIGLWQKKQGLIKGAKWYMLTADYAFGHDLYRVSSRFLKANGGIVMHNDMVPTNTPDYSPYIIKIRRAKPDFVYINLAGVDQTTFLKQYREYGLPYPLAGGVMDTVPFWAAGIESLSGYWQSLWYHGLQNPKSVAFTKRFIAEYGKPPDNQAWQDYTGIRIVLQAIAETKSTESAKLIEYFEKGARFDIYKDREAHFRDWDHQLLQEMYVVKVKDPSEAKDKWDIFEIVQPMPGPDDPLELIQPTREENPCTLKA
ncbi:MAG: ABC transporter substrate-binding protein [Nitrospinota bacterium]|nr:MAG: ABC transporter substrate-binding protein [Nitrospinota bacterium]